GAAGAPEGLTMAALGRTGPVAVYLGAMASSTSPIVLILAAGLGTRMKSGRAKVLHQVAGRPLVVWAVENARAAGAERVVALLGHQLDEVRAVLDARYGEGKVAV